jgi:hypothetical protein
MPFLARFAAPRLAALSLALAAAPGADAARDIGSEPAQLSDIELVLVEAEGCAYCADFRRVVAPRYLASPRSARVPLRFADVNDIDALSLEAPVTIVPTLLVLRESHEIGRLAGYTGPETFFRVLDRLLPASQ